MPSSALCLATLLLPISGLLQDADHRNLVGPFDLDMDVDCAMRNLTWAYARHLLPSRGPLLDVFDALRLLIDCNFTRPADTPEIPPRAPFYAVPSPRGGGSGARSVLRAAPPPVGALFVDAARGSDDGSGTEGAPFATVARALSATRARRAHGGAAIVLRGGVHHLRSPLVLGARDSGLTLTAYPGEAPVLSGGAALSPLAWSAVGPSPSGANATVWAAPLASQPGGLRLPFGALFDPTGRRATRARFPNGNPEYDIEPVGYTKARQWLPAPPFPDNRVQQDPRLGTLPRAVCPADACTQNGPQGIGPPWAIFCCFYWGWNASAINWTTGSFWGADPGPPGGGTAHMPGGMTAGADLAPRAAGWARPTDAIVHAFHGSYWGDWAFEVGGVNPINATAADLHFTRGGFQEARGAGAGDSLYVENLREELDAAGEWWVDAPSRTLFYAANGTSPPPSAGWVAGQLDNLVTLAGTAAEPVADVAIEGLTFEFSEPTFMKPFTVASGGDWSFHDGGALRLSGTRNCSVRGSLFVNLGGTGVMLSGWNRGAEVTENEFLWLGECAVISAGLSGDQYDNTAPGAAYGDAPVIARNLAHEFGLYVKQTGFLYAGMTSNMSVVENVFFNGPRAGINVNDGFGGGHDISRNVGFNLVRETTVRVETRAEDTPRCQPPPPHTHTHNPLPFPPSRTTACTTVGTATRTCSIAPQAPPQTRCPSAWTATCSRATTARTFRLTTTTAAIRIGKPTTSCCGAGQKRLWATTSTLSTTLLCTRTTRPLPTARASWASRRPAAPLATATARAPPASRRTPLSQWERAGYRSSGGTTPASRVAGTLFLSGVRAGGWAARPLYCLFINLLH